MEYLEELYLPHPIVGAIDKNPEQGVMLLDEKPVSKLVSVSVQDSP